MFSQIILFSLFFLLSSAQYYPLGVQQTFTTPFPGANVNFGYIITSTYYTVFVSNTTSGSCSPTGIVLQFVKDQTTGKYNYVYTITNPNDTTNSVHFGASISAFGEYLVIGAPNYCNDNAGSAIVFQYVNNMYQYMQYIPSAPAAAKDYFGCSVSMYSYNLAIGAFGANAVAGGVYYYYYNLVTWSYVTGVAGTGDEEFGSIVVMGQNNLFVTSTNGVTVYNVFPNSLVYNSTIGLHIPLSISLSFDQNYIIVGYGLSLEAILCTVVSGKWAVSVTLISSSNDNFILGSVMSLGDNILYLACPECLYSSQSGVSGGILVYNLSNSNWNSVQNLTISGEQSFGSSVIFLNNNIDLLVTCPSCTVNGNTGQGQIYVYNIASSACIALEAHYFILILSMITIFIILNN